MAGASALGLCADLVFLHEGLGCVQMWRNFPNNSPGRLAGSLNYSRAGYGGSDPAILPRRTDYMHNKLAGLPEVLDAFGIQSAVLVGHSDGGSISLIHAGSEAGARIKALILLAPHVFVELLSITSIRGGKTVFSTDLPERLARATMIQSIRPSGAGTISGFMPIFVSGTSSIFFPRLPRLC